MTKARTRTKAATSAKNKSGTDAPKNAIELDSIPPPVAEKKGFRTFSEQKPPGGWSQAGEALDRVRAVPTIFRDFNRATRVGGLPLRRIVTVHGPTHGGKTAAVAGFLRSFVEQNHAAAYVDAEHATDLTFFDELFECRCEDLPNFFAKRPKSYEETIDAADNFLDWMITERRARIGHYAKSKKPVPPDEDLAGLLVIDSLNKLVPAREMERLKKDGGEAIDKGWGRLRAAFNQAFLDHIVPLLGKAETCLVVMVQERDDDDLETWEMPTLKGGKASQYDASLIVRVMKGSEVKRGEKESRESFGFKHRLRIWKSKVGHMDGRWTDAAFHMSNGELVPPGFDLARDALELGRELGFIEGDGWLSWRRLDTNRVTRWQGAHNAVLALTKDPVALAALFTQIDQAISVRKVGR
jgi:RecA/RadA recombinase